MSDEFSGVTNDVTPASEQVPQAGQTEAAPSQPQANDVAANQTEALRVLHEKIDKLEKKSDFFEQQARYFQEQAPGEAPKPEYQPDDILTVAEAEKLFEKRIKAQEERSSAQRRYEQEIQLKAQYPDYEDVVKKLYEKLGPQRWQHILDAPNPAREAYELGKMILPEYARSATQGIAQQIQKNLNQPQTLTNVPGQSAAINPYSDIMKAPRDKFNDEVERLLNS